MKRENALIVFAKSPRRGPVKTRLSAHMNDAERRGLYRRLLEGTVEKLRDVPGVDTFISYAPPEEGGYFSRFGLETFAQSGGDIGERMHQAMKQVLGRGYAKAVLVGVDIPDISPAQILKALDLLGENDMVLGPATDGGYYLVGLTRPLGDVFHGIRWSTEHTLTDTLERASEAGLRTALTDTLSDIDTVEDLGRTGFAQGRHYYP